jgi:hypothetical protein
LENDETLTDLYIQVRPSSRKCGDVSVVMEIQQGKQKTVPLNSQLFLYVDMKPVFPTPQRWRKKIHYFTFDFDEEE